MQSNKSKCYSYFLFISLVAGITIHLTNNVDVYTGTEGDIPFQVQLLIPYVQTDFVSKDSSETYDNVPNQSLTFNIKYQACCVNGYRYFTLNTINQPTLLEGNPMVRYFVVCVQNGGSICMDTQNVNSCGGQYDDDCARLNYKITYDNNQTNVVFENAASSIEIVSLLFF